MPQKAVIKDGLVVNVIAHDARRTWTPPGGATLADIPDADGNQPHIGLAYTDDRFEQPAPEARPATDEAVNAHRDRIVASGASVDVGGVTLTMDLRDVQDFRNIQALYSRALTAKVEGEARQIRVRDSSDQEHLISADQMIALGKAVVDGVDAVYQASWAVKEQIKAGTLTEAADIPAAFDAILSPAP